MPISLSCCPLSLIHAISSCLYRNAWSELGDLSQTDAAAQFVQTLTDNIETFKPWLTRRLEEKEEQERKERELQARLERERIERLERERLEKERVEREARLAAEAEAKRKADEIARQEAEKQRLLLQQQQAANAVQSNNVAKSPSIPALVDSGLPPVQPHDLPYIELPDFLASVKGRDDCAFNVGRGEIVTVRVPNPEAGRTRIVWQFCTIDYDISFGMDYERTDPSQPQLPSVPESPDNTQEYPVQKGIAKVESVLPVIRTSSHEKVVIGAHSVDVPGCWLFHFDNTHSFFRSKTLYLRVACERSGV